MQLGGSGVREFPVHLLAEGRGIALKCRELDVHFGLLDASHGRLRRLHPCSHDSLREALRLAFGRQRLEQLAPAEGRCLGASSRPVAARRAGSCRAASSGSSSRTRRGTRAPGLPSLRGRTGSGTSGGRRPVVPPSPPRHGTILVGACDSDVDERGLSEGRVHQTGSRPIRADDGFRTRDPHLGNALGSPL